uniref:Uncharacterized protein n=1 Tax=Populus davidiana TaxID=266767 RepID=A0A6M2E6L0_9ROSI
MAAALSSLHRRRRRRHHYLTLFRKPSLYHLNKPLRSKRITSSLEFNITFAPPKPKFQFPCQPPKRPRFPFSPSRPALHSLDIPRRRWKPQAPFSPSGAFLHALTDAKTQPKKKIEEVRKGSGGNAKTKLAVEPRRSKAARRFYNEDFRDQAQRLSKVLAAAGVARSSVELIFEDGSAYNTPQD